MKSEAIAAVVDANADLLAIAQPVMDFELPEQTEIAPVFTP
jgi:hypothetical protein